MKKYFKIPPTPKGLPTFNGAPYSFEPCITYIIDHEPNFNEKISDSRKGKHLLDAMAEAFEVNGERWVEAEEDAINHLNKTLESPKCGWFDPGLVLLTEEGKPQVDIATGKAKMLTLPTRLFLSYADAPAAATHTDPRKAAAEKPPLAEEKSE